MEMNTHEFVLPLRNPELGNLNLLKWDVGLFELWSEGDVVFIILDSKQMVFCSRRRHYLLIPGQLPI